MSDPQIRHAPTSSTVKTRSISEVKEAREDPVKKEDAGEFDEGPEWIFQKPRKGRKPRTILKFDSKPLQGKESVFNELGETIAVSHRLHPNSNKALSILEEDSDMKESQEDLMNVETQVQEIDQGLQTKLLLNSGKNSNRPRRTKTRRKNGKSVPNHHPFVETFEPISAVKRLNNMEQHVLKILSNGNKEVFVKVDLGEFNVYDLKTFPFTFLGTPTMEDKFTLSEAFKGFMQGFLNSFNSPEGRRRVRSFLVQAQQKFIKVKWKQFKDQLSPEVLEMAKILRVEEEYPIFENARSDEWVEATTKMEALDEKDCDVLKCIIPEETGMSRLATLHLMSEFEMRNIKNYYVSEIRDQNLREDILSIPLLLRIQSSLSFEEKEPSFHSFTDTKISDTSELLNLAMQGVIKGVSRMEHGTSLIRFYELETDDWTESSVRQFFLNNPKHLEILESRLKALALNRNIEVQMFDTSDSYQNKPICATEKDTDPESGLVLMGEELAANYFGLDIQVLIDIKHRISICEQLRQKSRHIEPFRSLGKKYIHWSSKLPSEFDSHKEKLYKIGHFLYKSNKMKMKPSDREKNIVVMEPMVQ